jgi:hypothetical protein
MSYYWFRPRRYGYGAAPATWEGWAVTVVAVGIVIGSIVGMELLVDRSNFTAWMIWAVIIAGVTYWYARIARERTDGEWRWRWGAENKS